MRAAAEPWEPTPRRRGIRDGVTKRAVRLRVLFRKGRPLEVTPVEAGDEFPVNFWAGLFLETGSPPSGGQIPELAVDRILAFDQAGKQVAACRARWVPAIPASSDVSRARGRRTVAGHAGRAR